jgi:hypothetical protein
MSILVFFSLEVRHFLFVLQGVHSVISLSTGAISHSEPKFASSLEHFKARQYSKIS